MLFMGEKKKRLMPQMLRYQAFQRMVPVVGLEPTRCRHRRILNPLRLPFHHTGTFYRETPKILIGENKERTHYKSYILLYLGSLEKSRFLSEFILPDLLAFESTTSTNSITPAGTGHIIQETFSICKNKIPPQTGSVTEPAALSRAAGSGLPVSVLPFPETHHPIRADRTGG